MDDLDRKIARALIAETRNLREPTPFDAVKAALSIADARYQPRADAKPAYQCPTCNRHGERTSRCFHGPEGSEIPDVKPEAPANESAPDDATEEAIGLVAFSTGKSIEDVRRDMEQLRLGGTSRSVREIAAALRRRSGVRIETGESKAIDIVRRLAKVNGHATPIGIVYDCGHELVYDARALVALMARDGEGSR